MDRLRPLPPRWVLGVLAVQALVPLVVTLGSPVPSRLGFHMYSGDDLVTFSATDAEGRPIPIDDPDVGRLRSELPWTGRLPEHLCRQLPTAATVTVRQPDDVRTVKCEEP